MEVGEASRPVEDKVFVAVAEENGRSNLLWALENLAKDGDTIVIAHCTPSLASSTRTDSNEGREKAEKRLAEYEMMCKRRKVSYEEVIIEKDDVVKGLEELIAHYGITKLVVGAAADDRYSKQGGRNIVAAPPSPTEQALRQAELDLLHALKKTEDWKMLHQREVTKSEAAQKLLLRERQKVQEIKGQLEAVYSELDDAQELKQQITELNRAIRAQEEQLAANKCILEILEADNLELQHERDAALNEAEDLRRKSRLSDDAPAPSYFVCPIDQDVMEDPHIAADGFTYEGEAIRAWLNSGRDTSPMTNLRLPHSELTPNRTLRSAIHEWKQQQRQRHWD